MKRLTPVVLILLFLSGCGRHNLQDLKSFVRKAGQAMKGQVTPIPSIQQKNPYTYTAQNLRDPFEPQHVTLQASGEGPNLKRPRQPLEMYPLSSLKFVGTLYMNGHMQALIRIPDGRIITVSSGQYMGQDFGLITAISNHSIDLQETILDDKGVWVIRHTKVVLQGKSK
ncbi:MAG: pilus assembly protein PilP [Pseudomonadota bacterium]|nr:pilus assembly protein PilP [Pseudomonadota bacterium]